MKTVYSNYMKTIQLYVIFCYKNRHLYYNRLIKLLIQTGP